MVSGKVVRFDDVRGYGFISPDDGGDDVFVHANDLLDDKQQVRAGTRVTFTIEDGDRGLKATGVRIGGRTGGDDRYQAAPQSGGHGHGDSHDDAHGDYEVLNAADLRYELTEALLESAPTLTGAQIAQVRQVVTRLALAHDWVEA